MAFHGCVEGAITRLLYQPSSEPTVAACGCCSGATAVGFPSPLFFWQHTAVSETRAVDRESDMALTLHRHVSRRLSDAASGGCAVICGSSDVRDATRSKLERCYASARVAVFAPRVVTVAELLGDPALFPLRPSVVVLCLGGFPSATLAEAWRGPGCAKAFQMALDALIIVGHALWAVPPFCAPPHPIGVGLRKLNEEPLRIWANTTAPAQPVTIASTVMPLCCGCHPDQVRLLTADAAHGAAGPLIEVCQRICLSPYRCGVPHHVCLQKCHLSEGSTKDADCPFTCGRVMTCGHRCRMRCGEPCDCLEFVARDLDCSHEVVVPGTDGVTRRHLHRFEGPCSRAGDPCEVQVPLQCRHCDAESRVPCHVAASARAADAVTAASEGDEDANSKVTNLQLLSVCGDCHELERKLRSEIRVQLLAQAEALKQQRKREVEGQMFEQAKSAKSGMFVEGQRVAIKDVAGLRGRIDVLFPDVVNNAEGNCWSEVPLHELLGDHGKIAARCIDFVDTNEVLYLVALARGGHTVVADVGLELLKAVVHTNVGFDNMPNPSTLAIGNGSILLIAGGPSSSSGYAPTPAPAAADGGGSALQADALLLLRKQFPVGCPVYCTIPAVRLPSGVTADDDINNDEKNRQMLAAAATDDGACVPPPPQPQPPLQRESNVFGYVSVVGDNGFVYLRCTRDHHYFEAEATAADEPPRARARPELGSAVTTPAVAPSEAGEIATSPLQQPSDADDAPLPLMPREVHHRVEEFVLKAPPTAIEPLLRIGELAVAREPRRHVYAVDERRLFTCIPPELRNFTPVPLMTGEPCTIRAVVNYPRLDPGVSDKWIKSRGPCYVVTARRDDTSMRRWVALGLASAADAVLRVALVPVVFVEPDTEAKVDADLNDDLVVALEKRLVERFGAEVEQRYIRNVELHAKKQQIAARLAARQSATELAKPRVDVWGGGLALANDPAVQQRRREYEQRRHSERGDVIAARRRDGEIARATAHKGRDLAHQFASEHAQGCEAAMQLARSVTDGRSAR